MAILALGVDLFARQSERHLKIKSPDIPLETTSIVLIFHGSGGNGDPVISEIAESLQTTMPEALVLNYDWSQGSENRMRAAANGAQIGRLLGSELAKVDSLKKVKIVAHSVGASIPDTLCSTLKETSENDIHFETTYLDPFDLRDLLDFGYGQRNYGECSNLAIAYINTDDPAPSTNSPLRHAYNWDVTGAPGADKIDRNGHYWPLYYYRDLASWKEGDANISSHDAFPRGAFIPVKN